MVLFVFAALLWKCGPIIGIISAFIASLFLSLFTSFEFSPLNEIPLVQASLGGPNVLFYSVAQRKQVRRFDPVPQEPRGAQSSPLFKTLTACGPPRPPQRKPEGLMQGVCRGASPPPQHKKSASQ